MVLGSKMEDENNGVASQYKTESSGGSFLKGVDFDGNGLTLEVISMDVFTPENPKYGVSNSYGAGGVVTKENWFVSKGILKEGESFKYRFILNGVEKEFDNNSLSFYFAFTNVNPKRGETVTIKRNVISQTQVEWSITK